MEVDIKSLLETVQQLEDICKKLAESNKYMLETIKYLHEEREEVYTDIVMVMQVHNYPMPVLYRSITYPLNYVNHDLYEEI